MNILYSGDFLSLTPTKKHEELTIRYFSGKYEEVIEKIEVLLKEKMNERERITFQILLTKCLFNMREFTGEQKYAQEGYNVISEAYERSEKISDSNLLFFSGFFKVWFSEWIGKRKEAIELFDTLKKIMEDANKTHPNYSNLRKAMLKHIETFRNFLSDKLNDIHHDIHKTIQLRKEAIALLENDNNLKKLDYIDIQLLIFLTLGAHHNQIGDREQSFFYYNKALDIALETNNEYIQSEIKSTFASIFSDQGKIKEYLELTLEIIAQKERLGGIKSLAGNYASLGRYYYTIGEMKEFLEYTLKAYNISSENGTNDNPVFLDNLGLAYVNVGELDKALEIFKKSNELCKKHNWQWGIYSSQENLGHVYYLKGELEKAIELQEESRDYFEKQLEESVDQFFVNQFRWHLANNQRMIHFSYLKKGYVEKAIQALKNAFSLYKDTNSSLQAVNVLFFLINISSNCNQNDLAKIHFEVLKETLAKIDIPPVKRMYLLAEGVMLKSSIDSGDRVKAVVVFEQLLLEDLGFHLEVETLFNLCDLLLLELRETGNKNVLSKLQEYIEKLIKISKRNNLVALLIESLWFQAQLLLLEGNYEEAKTIISEASDLAEEKGYYQLSLKINSTQVEIFRKLQEIEDEDITILSIADRMNILEIENRFEQLKERQVFDIADLQMKFQF